MPSAARRVWAAVAVAAVTALAGCTSGAAAADVVSANVVLCGDTNAGCSRALPLVETEPLAGTSAFKEHHCAGRQCLPVQVPIGDWVADTVQVFNLGNAPAEPFTVGLYVSRRVDPVSKNCSLDLLYPLNNAIQIASQAIPDGLAAGASEFVSFPRLPQIESWMASQWNHGRAELFRCMFIWADDGQTVPELQSSESDNVISVPVKLLDLVELQPTDFQVNFNAAPWISGRVSNTGIATAPPFYVDFYQVDTSASDRCPEFTNKEFPLTLPRVSENYATYLGSVQVVGLQPGQTRVVFPQVSRLPGTQSPRAFTCLLMYVDAGLNVPEPNDGISNIRTAEPVIISAIESFVQPPEVVIIKEPWNKVIIVYAVAGFLGLLLICYAYYRWRKHLNKVHLNETQYLARMKLREKPPAERKKEPVPFFYPDEDFLALEHSNKNDNPDFDRVIRVGARARKTGVVKDKRGAIIGTISSGGVIRDKTGRRIGVSSYGAQPTEAKRKAEDNMRVGYFGGTT